MNVGVVVAELWCDSFCDRLDGIDVAELSGNSSFERFGWIAGVAELSGNSFGGIAGVAELSGNSLSFGGIAGASEPQSF